MDESTVRNWERGVSVPRDGNVFKLAERLEVDPAWLLGEDEEVVAV